MSEPTTLGSWLRRERERRGVTLAKISEETKVAVALLDGLETDDLSRWPAGIFRRAFVRSYATAIGLDPELVVRRVEEEHPSEPAAATAGPGEQRGSKISASDAEAQSQNPSDTTAKRGGRPAPSPPPAPVGATANRFQAVALDLLVAGSIGFGFAAAGSRLLWPVIAIAAYHALGLLLTGTTPMMALLTQPQQAQGEIASAVPPPPGDAPATRRENEPRQVRRARARRTARSEQAASGRH